MKNLILYISLLLIPAWSLAQVTTEPEDVDPTQPLKIIIDISKLDASKEYVQNLQADAAAGMPLYIWTWSPYEFPAGHPKANGTGATPWKNSNELLKLTKEAENIYSFTMTPTEFYEVDAATVYANDIKFLIKPKDGGGYGDPDRKSDDLTIAVDPPKLERDPAYLFPAFVQEEDIFILYYENDRETKASMKDLAPGDVYIYAAVTYTDSTNKKIESFFNVGSNPKLEMEYVGDGTFRKVIDPRAFFDVPAHKSIWKMDFIVMKKVFASGADRLDYTVTMDLRCD